MRHEEIKHGEIPDSGFSSSKAMSLHPVNGRLPDVLDRISGSTLVIPTVSIGNIPQLVIDLFIYNLEDVQLVGRLDPILLYPYAGPADYVEGSKPAVKTSAALEVYYSARHNLTVVQQRTPVLPGHEQEFLTEVIDRFITAGQFGRVLVLQSDDQGLIPDEYSGKTFKVWTNCLAQKLETALSLQDQSLVATVNRSDEVSQAAYFIFKHLKNLEPEEMALSIFAYEGDNAGHALQLYGAATQLIGVETKSENVPKSWGGLYGRSEVPAGMLYT